MASITDRLKNSLNSQKPGSLTCEKAMLPQETANTISSGATPESGHEWLHDPGRGDDGDGGRAQCDAQQDGDTPGEYQRRDVPSRGEVGDVVADSRIDQNLFERSTTGDDQDDHCHRLDRFAARLRDLVQ